MTIKFDLTKPKEKLQFVLQKHNVTTIVPCQVHLAFDVSLSFDDEHRSGYTQQLLNRIVPFSLLFDKNQTLDSYVFGSGAQKLDDININNFNTYVRTDIQRSSLYNSGTEYLPIFRMLVDKAGPKEVKIAQPDIQTIVEKKVGIFGKMFGKQDSVEIVSKKQPSIVTIEQEKHLVFFVTDGEAFDQENAKHYLNNALSSVTNPFFVFISIANKEFPFFANNYKNTAYSTYFNLTPSQLHDLQKSPDEDLYEMIISPSLEEWVVKT